MGGVFVSDLHVCDGELYDEVEEVADAEVAVLGELVHHFVDFGAGRGLVEEGEQELEKLSAVVNVLQDLLQKRNRVSDRFQR